MEDIQLLLVDDDVDDQEIFQMMLERISKDIKYTAAKNGVDALEFLNTNTAYIPDYIFLDVNMPKMNGVQCLAEIKKINRLDNTKIYLYSTTSEEALVEKSKALGAVDLIMKPASASALQQMLARILGFDKQG